MKKSCREVSTRIGSEAVVYGKNPKIAGAASPFGSSDLKHPSFPPVAKGLPSRDLVDTAVARTARLSTHIQ